MPWTVYCHTHIDSGRRYIGLTSQTMLHRWNQHCAQAKSSKGGRWHFPNAIRQYGKNAFLHEVLEICETLEAANLAEFKWIDHFDSRNPQLGFNLAKGGEHIPHQIRKNPWDDPEYREKAIRSLKNTWSDPKKRAEASVISKTALNKPEVRANMLAMPHVSLTKPEVREHRISALLISLTKPEVRANRASASKRNWEDPIFRKSISNSISSNYASRTGIICKKHGNVSIKDCYRRRSRIGKEGARLVCKLCVKEYNMKRYIDLRISKNS
jgi:hypothetical protein